jgi:glycosyltransferase EpsE
MCDDGSTDNTMEVAQQYVDRYPGKFILIKNDKNMGLNYTLNHCLEHVDTEYTARMDGDDISLPLRFEQEVMFLDEHPEYALVSGPMIYFDENGEFRFGKGGFEPTKDDYINGRTFCHAPCMIRTDAFHAVGGYSISKYLLRVEDQHLWLKLYQAGYRGYNLENPIYKMRDDRNAIRRRNYVARRNEMLHRIRICRTFSLPWYRYVASVIVPFIKWVMPVKLYALYHRNK